MNPMVLSDETSIVATFLASFMVWTMFFGLVFLWIIDGKVKREQALHALIAALVAWAFSSMIKTLLPMPRPFILDGIIPLTITLPGPNSSFPSAHSAVAFALATSIWMHNKKFGFRFGILAILVAYGRIISGVHYLQDVLVGIIIGILTALIIKKLHTFKLLG